MSSTAKPTTHRFGIDVFGPGAILSPGTTAQRAVNPTNGLTRVNTETKQLEFFVDAWIGLRGDDGYYATTEHVNTKLNANAKAVDSDKLDGYDSSAFARTEQVLTDVPANAVFTDTQRPVVNSLTSESTDESLSANQGKVLKTLIDNINAVLLSNDTSLDELQELVNFIKQNKSELDSLSIENIAGLLEALAGKLAIDGKAVDSAKLDGNNAAYYTDIVSRLGWKPVQQGGGVNQGTADIKIGNRASDSQLLLQVNDQDYQDTWPLTSTNTEKLNGQSAAYYAKASNLLTPVPEGAVFTDTWRPVSDSVASTSVSSSASSLAVKTAFDKGVEALTEANKKLNAGDKAVDSDKLDGKDFTYFAKAADVLTPVPTGAVFTDTQVPLSNLVSSTSETTAASSKAVKTAFDKGTEALLSANLKLGFNEKAVDSDKLNGQPAAYYAKTSDLQTPVPTGAVFTDTQRGVVDNLTSTSITESLTANQGRVLKALIDNIASIISSDDAALDEIQEIVNYIKQNKEELSTLDISNIAGLIAALDGKLPIDGKAVDSTLFNGNEVSFFAPATDVKTPVPAGAVFTDTWRPISDSVTTSSTSTSASLTAVKTAYDRGTEALQLADTKMTDGAALAGPNGLTYWQKSYTVSAESSSKLRDKSDNVLNPNRVYRVNCHVASLDANALVAVLHSNNGWKSHLTAMENLDVNQVNIVIDTDGEPSLVTTSTEPLTVNVYHESYHGAGQTGKGLAEQFGSDGYLTSLTEGLFYKDAKVFTTGNMGTGSGLDAERLNGQLAEFYAKSSDLQTPVPTGAVFTDTWRPVVDAVNSTSKTSSGSANAVKSAYDLAQEAYQIAESKLPGEATAINAERLGGQVPAYYVKASDVLTPVPAGAVFTDTQVTLSNSTSSASTASAATSLAAKTAYDKGAEALQLASEKLDANAAAVDSNKLNGQSAAYYAKASDLLTPVPEGAVFTDTWRDTVDNLLSTSTVSSLTANQGRNLKAMIDDINAVLNSDDLTLDEFQEIVDFIKQNKTSLEALGISNIAGLESALLGKLAVDGKAVDSERFDGQLSSYYAKSSEVLTPVPLGAVFTDTQVELSNSVISVSETVAASSKAVKTAYDKGNQALSVAIGKLDANAAAVDSDKFGNQLPAYYAKVSDLQTAVPEGAVFTDTWRPVSDAVDSAVSDTAASSQAVKTAYDKGTAALTEANKKLNANAKAVDSDKLDGKDSTEFVGTQGDQSVTGVKTFNDGISLGGGSRLSYDSLTESMVFSFI